MTATSETMIARLVGFDTVSRKSNLGLIDYVKDYLAGFGVQSRLVFNADKSKANLYATVGPAVEGGVVLSGHTDVVPVDGQPWTTEPFETVEKDGKLFGRGTADMKSFIAIGLSMVPEMLARGLQRPVHFALSYDEEVGCVGAPSMISEMAERIPRPSAVVVGEPTSMRMVVAHKGTYAFRTTITGHEAHSSQPHRGVSAVMTAARLITFIEDMMLENKAAADPANRFEPPYTTLHVGKVEGGTALNIISRECSFVWDIRTVPGDDWRSYFERFQERRAALLAMMQAIAPAADIQTEILAAAPGLRAESESAAADLIRALTGQNDTYVVSYGAEAGQFQEAGFATIMCGPGSIDQAHQPNEFIEVSQVRACEQFMRRLIDRLAA